MLLRWHQLCEGTIAYTTEEHVARLKAEAEAEHATRRLAVAQEQIAEYAQQREGEAGSLLEEVAAVERAMSAALERAGEAGPSSLGELGTHVQASGAGA